MAHVLTKTKIDAKGKEFNVYYARWQEDKKAKQKTFTLKKEAKKFSDAMHLKHEAKEEAKAETHVTKLTFLDVAKDYLHALKVGFNGKEPLEAQTLRTYTDYLTNHAYPHFAEKGGTLATITEADIEAIRDRVMTHKNNLSSRSGREVLRLTRAVLKFAVARGYIAAVPGSTVTIVRTRAEKTAERANRLDAVFTPRQIKTLLLAADSLATDRNKTRRNAWLLYRPLAYLLIHTGVRISEARGFPRKSFNEKKGLIEIRQRAAEKGEVGGTKSADGVRDIPLNAGLIEPMRAALKAHKRDLIFSTAGGQPMEYHNLYNRMLKPLVARANELAKADPDNIEAVPFHGFHAIRHSTASRLIAAGANLKQLQTWMGHNDPAFTLRVYGHLFHDDENTKSVMEKMLI